MARRRSPSAFTRAFEPELFALCDELRAASTRSLARARGAAGLARLARPVQQGAGDVAYGIDLPCERVLARWHERLARRAPLSLCTEDSGWRHLGPGARGGVREFDGFDHGGARIAVDPIDGTRNLMADLRSAWSVISFAPPGAAQPRLRDLSLGIVSELPNTLAGRYRVLWARDGRAHWRLYALRGARVLGGGALRADRDARADHGYFPFFRYTPAMRPALARLEADFFARCERELGAELRHVFDDQYISNAGQLALLALGTYRMIVDARALLSQRLGLPSIPSKPYDMAGAIVVARAAGCALTAADGAALDFPIDVTTPVHFAGFHNRATQRRLAPRLCAALRSIGI